MMKAQRSVLSYSFVIISLMALVCSFSLAANAQSPPTANLGGRVMDVNGHEIRNATVTVANSSLGYSRSANSGADGSFRFVAVPVERYDLVASASGFAITRAVVSVKPMGASVRITLMPLAQQQGATGNLSGTISLGDSGQTVHDATVTIIQLRKTVYTDESGKYEFQTIPPGHYDVMAHLNGVPDSVQSVDVTQGNNTLNITLHLSGVTERVTITATGTELAVSSSIQSVDVIGSTDLAKKNPVSLGEALDTEAGIAKRSFGPGTARPVIRGFDGDRVLVLQDGNRIGSLGFESGDHAEPVDLLTIERVEVVKGPATLLYGSNAVGGVVNVIEGHTSAHKGTSGFLSGIGSSNNNQAGGSGGIEYGTDKWLFWGNGGGQRTGDYKTRDGVVPNSFSRNYGLGAGLGYFREKGFFRFNYEMSRLRYGIPFDPNEVDPEIVHLNPRRDSFKFNGGFRGNTSFIEAGSFSVQYNRYRHAEINSQTNETNTAFTSDWN